MDPVTAKLMSAAGAASDPIYVDDVFAASAYQGATNAALSITNGIDLAGEGGLVWTKNRGSSSDSHILYDTERGKTKRLSTDNTDAESTDANGISSFDSNGYSLDANGGSLNGNGDYYCSWTSTLQ